MIAKRIKKWTIEEWEFSKDYYAPNSFMKTHCDGFFHVSIIISGSVRETSGTVEEDADTFSMVTKAADVKHSNQFGPNGAYILSLKIPQARLNTPSHSSFQLCPWHWIHNASVFNETTELIYALNTISFSKEPAEIDWCKEQIEIFLDAITGVNKTLAKEKPKWLLLARNHIHDTYKLSVPVKDIAKDVGVHPTYLTRCFQNFYGCSVTTYRHRIRVKRAINKLTAKEVSLVQIALDCGFYDQSHFTHIFRKLTGETPYAFRNLIKEF